MDQKMISLLLFISIKHSPVYYCSLGRSGEKVEWAKISQRKKAQLKQTARGVLVVSFLYSLRHSEPVPSHRNQLCFSEVEEGKLRIKQHTGKQEE
jgi:hypothetical protein